MECISPSCYQNIYRFDEVSLTQNWFTLTVGKHSCIRFSWKKVKSMYDWYHLKDASFNGQDGRGIAEKTDGFKSDPQNILLFLGSFTKTLHGRFFLKYDHVYLTTCQLFIIIL